MTEFSKPDGATPIERAKAMAKINKVFIDASKERAAFAHRGFSDRLVEALVACGIDAPERLLLMDVADLQKIPGVGKKTMGEIQAYRDRFLIR